MSGIRSATSKNAALLGFALCSLAPGMAHATAGLECGALDGSGATVEMNLPRLGLPAMPNWVRVSADGFAGSTLAMDGATPLALLQAFDDGRTFAIDLSDDQASEIVASIRVLSAEEGEDRHYIGYLHLVGQSIHPISCTESE
jgi:hypothetical protein